MSDVNTNAEARLRPGLAAAQSSFSIHGPTTGPNATAVYAVTHPWSATEGRFTAFKGMQPEVQMLDARVEDIGGVSCARYMLSWSGPSSGSDVARLLQQSGIDMTQRPAKVVLLMALDGRWAAKKKKLTSDYKIHDEPEIERDTRRGQEIPDIEPGEVVYHADTDLMYVVVGRKNEGSGRGYTVKVEDHAGGVHHFREWKLDAVEAMPAA